MPPTEWVVPLPKPCLMTDPEEERKLRALLISSCMAELVPEHLALLTSFGRKVLSGLFAVPHKEEADRLNFDRRPQNETERRLNWAKLPHGMLLIRLRLAPDSTARGPFQKRVLQSSWASRVVDP